MSVWLPNKPHPRSSSVLLPSGHESYLAASLVVEFRFQTLQDAFQLSDLAERDPTWRVLKEKKTG